MTGPANHDPTNDRDEYEDLDSDQVVEDAIEYFDEPSETDSPAADADAPPPG